MASDSEAMRSRADDLRIRATTLRGALYSYSVPSVRREIANLVVEYETIADQLERLADTQERVGR